MFIPLSSCLVMRRVISVGLLALVSLPLVAQVTVGAKAGGVLADIAIKGVGLGYSGDKAKPKISYLAGVVLTMPVRDQLSVQAELLYSNKGTRGEFIDLSNERSKISTNYHYVSLPLLLRYHPTNRLAIGVGPEVAYLLGAYQRTDAFGSNRQERFYKPIDVAVNLDVQYDLLEKLSLGLRYSLGVYDITKRYEGNAIGDGQFVVDSDIYNRSLQLSLTYWLK